MRSMISKWKGTILYESHFDEKTGVIVRKVIDASNERDLWRIRDDTKWEKRYKNRYDVRFSPVPETVDVSITDKCDFGCTYCYQDSKPRRPHAPKELVETIIKGFDQPPYQMAIGGGEPTMHPDLPYILRKARELGTVPNYTTAGHHMTDEIVAVTNEVCGGVAMTYHTFKGLDWFLEHYESLRNRLTCQVNVHLIADKNVARNLAALTKAQEKVGRINLVLLAYYPDVGRASLDVMMTRTTYQKHLPEALAYAKSTAMQIAFSEGLLPYFNSRPELGIDTKFALPSEGVFSCYVDPRGFMTHSSFEPADRKGRFKPEHSVFTERSQVLWDGLRWWGGSPSGERCYGCPHRSRCSTPTQFHAFTCAYESHNRLPLVTAPNDTFEIPTRTAYDRLLDED